MPAAYSRMNVHAQAEYLPPKTWQQFEELCADTFATDWNDPALLGALIPQSEQEEAALGDVATKVRETARNAAQGVVDRGTEIAEQVLAAGQESASAHGLSADTSVGELIESARSGDLLDKVEGTARDTLQSTQTALRDGAPKSSKGDEVSRES